MQITAVVRLPDFAAENFGECTFEHAEGATLETALINARTQAAKWCECQSHQWVDFVVVFAYEGHHRPVHTETMDMHR